jgi:hypothetical protein
LLITLVNSGIHSKGAPINSTAHAPTHPNSFLALSLALDVFNEVIDCAPDGQHVPLRLDNT